MRQNVFKGMQLIFWVLVIADIMAIAFTLEWLHQLAKPLLIPALFLLLFKFRQTEPGKYILLTGLFFSWLGDVFLLFENEYDLFFIFGLVSFLITHAFYILYFLKIRSSKQSLLLKHPVLIALVLAYGISLVWQLYPVLGDMKLPVMIYAAVICSMLICSLHVFAKIPKPAAWLFLCGAIAFVLSDSLLAVNRFYHPFPYAGVWVMLSYCAAQFLIVKGFIEFNRV